MAGGLGQLGTGLARKLRQQYGTENIILSDIIRPNREILDDGKPTYKRINEIQTKQWTWGCSGSRYTHGEIPANLPLKLPTILNGTL